MMHAAWVGRRPVGADLALLIGEHRDQAPVARIKVEVALGRVIEVGLLEHKRHPQHPLPKIDRRLPIGTDDRDVMNPLALKLAHCTHLSTSLDLYSLRRRLPHGTSSTRVCTTSVLRNRAPIAS